MPQQACIFCERAKPLVTITKEHLFSRWVDRILTPEMLGPDRSFERTVTGPDGVATNKTWPTEVIAAIEASVVCGSSADGCNGGWMGNLDGLKRSTPRPDNPDLYERRLELHQASIHAERRMTGEE